MSSIHNMTFYNDTKDAKVIIKEQIWKERLFHDYMYVQLKKKYANNTKKLIKLHDNNTKYYKNLQEIMKRLDNQDIILLIE